MKQENRILKVKRLLNAKDNIPVGLKGPKLSPGHPSEAGSESGKGLD